MSELATISEPATSEMVRIGDHSFEVLPQMMRKIDTLKIGQPVRVLKKEQYSKEHKVLPGVVIGFEPFKDLPTVVIACADICWSSVELKFIQYNTQARDVQVVASAADDFALDRDTALRWFDRKEEELTRQIADLKAKREFFQGKFATSYSVTPRAPTAIEGEVAY